MDRAVQLLIEYADAKEIEATVEYGVNPYQPKVLTCTLEQINGRLGTDFTAEEVNDVFKRLYLNHIMKMGFILVQCLAIVQIWKEWQI